MIVSLAMILSLSTLDPAAAVDREVAEVVAFARGSEPGAAGPRCTSRPSHPPLRLPRSSWIHVLETEREGPELVVTVAAFRPGGGAAVGVIEREVRLRRTEGGGCRVTTAPALE